jgi:hypothetical protein
LFCEAAPSSHLEAEFEADSKEEPVDIELEPEAGWDDLLIDADNIDVEEDMSD